MDKAYLGDGVYVFFDGYGLVLTTENGISVTNEIYFEPEVYAALLAYVAHLPRRAAAPAVLREREVRAGQGDRGGVGAEDGRSCGMTIDRGTGNCPKCKATVRLVRFRGSTADHRDGQSVIGRHRVGLDKAKPRCDGEQDLPADGAA